MSADFADIITEEQFKDNTAAGVICDNCGLVLVDHKGTAVNKPEEIKNVFASPEALKIINENAST